MIVGVHHGAVYVPKEGQGDLQAVAYWPQRNAGSAVMLGFAEQAYSVRRSVLHKAADDRDQAAEVRDFVAFPLSVNGQVLGVIALALEIRSEAQRQAVVQLLEIVLGIFLGALLIIIVSYRYNYTRSPSTKIRPTRARISAHLG